MKKNQVYFEEEESSEGEEMKSEKKRGESKQTESEEKKKKKKHYELEEADEFWKENKHKTFHEVACQLQSSLNKMKLAREQVLFYWWTDISLVHTEHNTRHTITTPSGTSTFSAEYFQWVCIVSFQINSINGEELAGIVLTHIRVYSNL